MESPAPPADPPSIHEFRLHGLSEDEIVRLRAIDGMREVQPLENGWTRFTWWYQDSAGNVLETAAMSLYEFFPIRGRLGRTVYTHGNATSATARSVIRGHAQGFFVAFDDEATGHNELLRLSCFACPDLGQVEHEMLRDVAGTRAIVERCGDGYAVVSRASRGVFTVWQVSEQSFVRINNSFDREMVSAYVSKWGSVTPADVDLSVDKWVRDEIRWRIPQLDWAYSVDQGRPRDQRGVVDVIWVLVTPTFPDLYRLQGQIPSSPTLAALWDKLCFARHWLWANHGNFRYDDATRGYVLAGPDRYDPASPPVLPEELRGPPRPEANE